MELIRDSFILGYNGFMKIAYCGHDFFHNCLQTLLQDEHEVIKVFTVNTNNENNFNQYILDNCRSRNIPFSLDPINAEDIDRLREQEVEYLVSAAYNYKIPDLSNSGIKGLNLHPTLLPEGRGVWPLPWIILLNHRNSGLTLHKLTEQWDAGDILLQEAFPVDADEILESLSVKCQLLAQKLIRQFFKKPDHYWLKATEQKGGNYWPMPDQERRHLDWTKTVEELDRIARAFGKFGCFAHFEQQDWMVYSLKVWPQQHNYQCGSVIHRTNTEMIIAAKDGLVSLLYFNPLT